METNKLSISTDFSKTPGPRYVTEGDHSGELFRKEKLSARVHDAIETNKKLLIDLDETAGYGTSFLEEAFGGLIRVDGLKNDDILKCLQFKSDEEPYLIDDIIHYLKDAQREKDESK